MVAMKYSNKCCQLISVLCFLILYCAVQSFTCYILYDLLMLTVLMLAWSTYYTLVFVYCGLYLYGLMLKIQYIVCCIYDVYVDVLCNYCL